MSFQPGFVFGDYRVEAILGRGGMGKVYKVRNLLSDRVDAMKVLLPDLTEHPDLVDRFLREIKIQASLHHPNIAALYTAIRLGKELVMIMELVDGVTLEAMIQQGVIEYGDAIGLFDQVLQALVYAHELGVTHRDIKPANIMVTANGTVKLMDFGIARTTDKRLTATGIFVGSLHYMSPEQIRGVTPDARSDIYSLGLTLYEAVTGTRAIQGDSDFAIMSAHLEKVPRNPVEINSAIPPALGSVILRAIDKQPEKRFQSATEFLSALNDLKREPQMKPTGTFLTTVRIALEQKQLQVSAQRTAELGEVDSTPTVTRLAPGTASPSAGTAPPVPATASPVQPRNRTALWVGAAVAAALAVGFTAKTMLINSPASNTIARNAVPESGSQTAAPAQIKPAESAPADKPHTVAPERVSTYHSPSREGEERKSAPQQAMPALSAASHMEAVPPPPQVAVRSATPALSAPTPSIPIPAPPAVTETKPSAQDEWQRVASTNSVAAIEDYLRKNPGTPFGQQARAKAEALEWDAVRSSKDPAALLAFRNKYPSGPHAEQAAGAAEKLDSEASQHGIREALSRYQNAYGGRDSTAVKAAWPTLSGDDLKKIESFFKATKAAQMKLEPAGETKVRGDTASVPCTRSIVAQMKDGSKQTPPVQRVTVQLKKFGSTWAITSIE